MRSRSLVGLGAVAALALTLGWVLSLATTRVKNWFVMSDELYYERLAISVAQTGSLLPRVHGEIVSNVNQLYPRPAFDGVRERERPGEPRGRASAERVPDRDGGDSRLPAGASRRSRNDPGGGGRRAGGCGAVGGALVVPADRGRRLSGLLLGAPRPGARGRAQDVGLGRRRARRDRRRGAGADAVRRPRRRPARRGGGRGRADRGGARSGSGALAHAPAARPALRRAVRGGARRVRHAGTARGCSARTPSPPRTSGSTSTWSSSPSRTSPRSRSGSRSCRSSSGWGG